MTTINTENNTLTYRNNNSGGGTTDGTNDPNSNQLIQNKDPNNTTNVEQKLHSPIKRAIYSLESGFNALIDTRQESVSLNHRKNEDEIRQLHRQHEQVSMCNSCLSCRIMPIVIHGALFFMFAGSFIYNLYWDITHSRLIVSDWIYLTHWNLTFQIFFTGMELLADFFTQFSDRTAMFRAKLFHTIVFPFSLFVASYFWILCLVDESMIREKPEIRSDEWYNHVVHTMIVPAALLESMATYHKLSSIVESFTITTVCAFTYICWAVMWGTIFNMWSYELFRSCTHCSLAVLFVASCIMLCVFQAAGRVFHRKLWITNQAHHHQVRHRSSAM